MMDAPNWCVMGPFFFTEEMNKKAIFKGHDDGGLLSLTTTFAHITRAFVACFRMTQKCFRGVIFRFMISFSRSCHVCIC